MVNAVHSLRLCFLCLYAFIYVCVCVYLEFHVSVGLLRAELHLFLELLQRHICLLDLLSLALPGSVQLALHLPSKQTHRNEYTKAIEWQLQTRYPEKLC